MLKFNKKRVAEPSAFKVDFIEREGERYQNTKGETVKDVLAIKRVLYSSWDALTQSEISLLLKEVNKPFLSIEYPDPEEGITEKVFEVASREMPMFSKQLPMYGEENEYVWEGLSMIFIEK